MKKRSANEEEGDDDLDNELLGILGKKEDDDMQSPAKKRRTEDTGRLIQGVLPEKETYTDEDFDDGYDPEGFGDEEDTQKLMAMTEFERETILGQRLDKRDKLLRLKEQMRKEGRLIAKVQEKAGRSRSKGPTPAKTEDSKTRSQSALADLKTKREAIKQKGTTSTPTKERDTKTVKSDNDSRKKDEKEDHKYKIKLLDLQRIVLTRQKLEDTAHEPFFEKMVKGCFVRVLLGQTEYNKRTYRLAEISDISTAKIPYTAGIRETNKLLMLKHGVAVKSFRIDKVSNQEVSQVEFNKWVEEMEKCEEELPTLAKIEAKYKEVKECSANEHEYTEEDVSKILEQKKEDLEKLRVSELSRKKAALIKLRDECKESDPAKYEEAGEKLKEVERRMLDLEKNNSSRIANINAKNRAQNMTKKSSQRQTGETKLDPFARKSTQSTSLFSYDFSTPSPKADASASSAKTAVTPLSPKERSDLKEAHNFDLDINLEEISKPDAQPLKSTPTKSAATTSTDPSPVKKISLSDYKKKKGL